MSTRTLKPFALLCLAASCALALSAAACKGEDEQGGGPVEPTAATAEEAVWPTEDWEVSTPEDQGMDSARLEAVAEYVEKAGGGAAVIIRHGRLVWEDYWGGWDENRTDISYSMAKSFTSALVGIAIAEGHIRSVDQAAADFVEEWRGTDKERITLRHLLTLTSGLQWEEGYSGVNDVTKMASSEDQVAYVLARPLAVEPGTRILYSTGDPEVFSRILLVATGKEAENYAKEKIFDVIGMPKATWLKDTKGHTTTYCCVFTTAREFAKFGYLYLRGGRWEDKQVVPAEWVEESTRAQEELYPTHGYGLLWHVPTFADVPRKVFDAEGIATKYIYVVPDLDIVAVRLGMADNNWDGNTFLGLIAKAVTDADQEGPGNE
jgi:CubicO group peptidase (beta-lactamase class C family)